MKKMKNLISLQNFSFSLYNKSHQQKINFSLPEIIFKSHNLIKTPKSTKLKLINKNTSILISIKIKKF
jgi:hypothetical protein